MEFPKFWLLSKRFVRDIIPSQKNMGFLKGGNR